MWNYKIAMATFRESQYQDDNEVLKCFECGEGKRRNEFAEGHVAWLAEWHNYTECKVW